MLRSQTFEIGNHHVVDEPAELEGGTLVTPVGSLLAARLEGEVLANDAERFATRRRRVPRVTLTISPKLSH
jgi:hypothetical protein